MLDVLVKEDIHNCIVVVTRYFGGTLLGTGGLVRAYQKSTQEGLANSTIIERKSGKQMTISTDYNGIGKIQYLISKNGITIMDSRYTDTVELDVMIPADIFASFCAEVTESTSGKAGLSSGDSVEFAVIDGEVLLFS
jgi:putative IMPACT (imprinted ancient) family translation regulator